jgi:hypothetical protein
VKTGEEMLQVLVVDAKEISGHYPYMHYAYGGESEMDMYEKILGWLTR